MQSRFFNLVWTVIWLSLLAEYFQGKDIFYTYPWKIFLEIIDTRQNLTEASHKIILFFYAISILLPSL